MTADEAHKPHSSEIRAWLSAFQSDRHRARSSVSDYMYRLLHTLAYLTHGDVLTEKGQEELACAG